MAQPPLCRPSAQCTWDCLALLSPAPALPPPPLFPLPLPPLSRLLFGGTQCLDTATLEEAKVKAGDSLCMVLALRGGAM